MDQLVSNLIKECKTLIEQGEPFQKKMKAKHSRLKKRVIGHGGQQNTPPYSEKPSMERSKSAPPIGEGIMDLAKKYRNYAAAAALSVGLGAGMGAAATQSVAQQPKKEISSLLSQDQQTASKSYLKFYDAVMLQELPSQKLSFEDWQNKIKINIKSQLRLNNVAAEFLMKDLGIIPEKGKPFEDRKVVQRAAMFSKLASEYEVKHKGDSDYHITKAVAHAMTQMSEMGVLEERKKHLTSKRIVI